MDKLFKETVVDFRQRYLNTPEIKSWISPELRYSLEQEERQATASKKASLWKQDELNTAQNQLSALRNSLGTLKMQAERLQQQLLQGSDGYSSTDKITAITDKVEGTIVTTAGKGAA